MFRVYFFVPLTGFLTSWFLSLVIKKFAHRYGLFDSKSWRKLHSGEIPRLAGFAIAAGFALPILIIFTFNFYPLLNDEKKLLFAIMVGGFFSLCLGIFDDLKRVSSKAKLLGQLLIGLFVTSLGVKINAIWLPGVGLIELGQLAVPVTIFWFVLCMNAVNLSDGLDGLCATLILVSMLVLFFMSWIESFMFGILLTLAISGSLVGFLVHNFNPASIFMGDGGSYFLGFLLAAFSIVFVDEPYRQINLFPSIFLVGLPLFDTVFAVFRRLMTKRSIFAPDWGHVHHCFLKKGLSVRKVWLILTLFQMLFCVISVILYLGNFWFSSGAWIAAMAIFTYLFFEVIWRFKDENSRVLSQEV